MSLFQRYHDQSIQKIEINPELQKQMAEKLFFPSKRERSIRLLRSHPSFSLASGFLLLALIIGGFNFTPVAHAAQSLRDSFHILIERAFDPNRDVMSDSDLERLKSDPSIDALEYSRTVSGETVSVQGHCDQQGANGGCTSSFEGIMITPEPIPSSEGNVSLGDGEQFNYDIQISSTSDSTWSTP